MDNETTLEQTQTTEELVEQKRVKNFNRNKWLFSLGGIGRDMSYQLVAAFLLIYVQFGVSLSIAQFTTLGLIIGIGGRIWDALNDPVMGAIIEGSHMKWGKFKPWILIGAVTSGIIIIAMFNVRIWSGWNFVIFMTVMYFLWESTFTMNDIGYWSMLPSLSSKKGERNSVTTLTVVFAGVGAFIGQGIVTFLTPGNVVKGYSMVSIIIVVAMVGCQIMTSVGVKETPRTEKETQTKVSMKHLWNTIRHNDQVLWMTLSMFLYTLGSGLLVALAYNLYYLEVGYDNKAIIFIVIFGVCSIFANLLYPKLSKFGRKKVQLLAALLTVFGYLALALLGWWSILPFNIITMSVCGFFIFSGQTLYYMASIINMTNCVEYNEYKRGERSEAIVSTLRPFMVKFAAATQYGVVMLVLIVSGVFALSQNISLMESQKNYLININSTTEQVQYIETIKGYLDIYENAEDKEVANEIIAKDLETNENMASYQIKVEYVQSLGSCRIYRDTYLDGNLKVANEDLGFWKDIEIDVLLDDADTTSYEYSMEILDKDSTFNAANDNFKGKRTTSMRLWLRASTAILPAILIALSWFVQRKKFIIDEDYYDMMLTEIDKCQVDGGEVTSTKDSE